MNDYERHACEGILGLAAITVQRARDALTETRIQSEDFESLECRKVLQHVLTAPETGKLDAALLQVKTGVERATLVALWSKRDASGAIERLRLLKDRSKRRLYAENLTAIQRTLANTDVGLADAISESSKLLEAWKADVSAVTTLDSNIFSLIDDLESIQQGKKPPTLATGLESWDCLLGGLQPTLTVIGALPATGKSATVCGIIRMLAARRVKVGICSLEDERGWLTRRLLSNASRVPLFVLANKPLTNSQMAAVNDSAEHVYRLLSFVHVDDRSGLRTSEVVASCREMISAGCKAVFVDHLGEIALTRSERHDLDIADALRELRSIAKTTRTPIVVVTHMKRRDGLNVDTEPKLTDFAFSSGVERMARVAVGLYRDGDELRCTVLKQTQGVANVSFGLVMDSLSGVVIESPASSEARNMYAN